jgi:hypothetical protein
MFNARKLFNQQLQCSVLLLVVNLLYGSSYLQEN